jgi:predicted secreted hydrolase
MGFGLWVILMPWASAYGEAWKIAGPNYAWAFPQDHWVRPEYKTEWWYFTGHLQSQEGRKFGYQFTFFRVGLFPDEPDLDSDWAANHLIMGHAAISDLETGSHYFSETLYRAIPLLGGFGAYPDTLLAWSLGPVGTRDKWTLSFNGQGFGFVASDVNKKIRFDLRTQPTKPLIFQGPNGLSKKGNAESAASQYYSFTRLATEGSLTVGDETFEVTGQSWMDKEFGSNQLDQDQEGWDWFGLQMDDGTDLMLYVIRGKTRTQDEAHGTVISAQGQVRYLGKDAFDILVTDRWTSAQTKTTYPAGWMVTVKGDVWTVLPEMNDQENRCDLLEGLFYWEGAVKVFQEAREIGRGYVELTGYGVSNVPGL